MKIFFGLLLLFLWVFALRCHFTFSYILYPFLLMFPATEVLELTSVQEREMRHSVTDLHTYFHKRYISLRHTIIGTSAILFVWNIYLLMTLETCSVELSLFSSLLMLIIAGWYGWYYWKFIASPPIKNRL